MPSLKPRSWAVMRRRWAACQAGSATAPNRISLPSGLCANAAILSYGKARMPSGMRMPVIRISTGMISAATNPPAAKGSHRMGLFDRAMTSNPRGDQHDERYHRPDAIMHADDRLGRDGFAAHRQRHGLRGKREPGHAVIDRKGQTNQLEQHAQRAGQRGQEAVPRRAALR